MLLLLVAIICTFSSRASAQITLVQDGVKFEVDTTYTKEACVIPNEAEPYKGNIIIPECVYVENQITHEGNLYPVTSIKELAFSNCKDLESVIIPDEVTEIGGACFAQCDNLKQVRLPDNLTKLNERTFAGCKSLQSIDIPQTVKIIGLEAFCGCGIDSIDIPNSVTEISQGAFMCCDSLKFIKLSDSLEYVGTDCFRESGLEKVTIPNAIANYRGNFIDCKNLKSVKLPEGLTNLGSFAGCTSLAEIKIPQSIKEIGDHCFSRCRALTSIELPNALTKLGSQSFYETSLASVTLPATLVEYNQAFDHCDYLTEILVDEQNPKFSTIDGILFNKEKDVIYQYPMGKKEIEYTVPSNVRGLAAFSFAYSHLKSVNLPEGLSFIGSWCFNESEIENINIPNSIKSISYRTFGGCRNLKSIILPTSLTELDYESFAYCTNLNTVYSLASTPPSAIYDTFEKCPKERILYVPEASLETYKMADVWKEFFQILPIETAGISNVLDSNISISSPERGKISIKGLHVGEIIQYYNTSGMLIQTCKATSNEVAFTTSEPIIIIKTKRQTKKIFVQQ